MNSHLLFVVNFHIFLYPIRFTFHFFAKPNSLILVFCTGKLSFLYGALVLDLTPVGNRHTLLTTVKSGYSGNI